jgi:hypothetical protein
MTHTSDTTPGFRYEPVSYAGWPHCYRLSNEHIELVVTGDVGPRIIRLGFVGDVNEFVEIPADLGQTGGEGWRMYGGHRLWHAPEDEARTYAPDNSPITVEQSGGGVRLTQPTEPATGIQKQIELHLWPDSPRVQVTHRLRNMTMWAVELAPWALSCMAAGGTAVFPLPPRGAHPENLLPNGHLVVWPYTDLSDPRWRWGRTYIALRQDSARSAPQKIGGPVPQGWAAHWRGGHLFLKVFKHQGGAVYPDEGCSVEVFTNADMLELETLGPMTRLGPNQAVEHVETWSLLRDVPGLETDEAIDAHVLPELREVRQTQAPIAGQFN